MSQTVIQHWYVLSKVIYNGKRGKLSETKKGIFSKKSCCFVDRKYIATSCSHFKQAFKSFGALKYNAVIKMIVETVINSGSVAYARLTETLIKKMYKSNYFVDREYERSHHMYIQNNIKTQHFFLRCVLKALCVTVLLATFGLANFNY